VRRDESDDAITGKAHEYGEKLEHRADAQKDRAADRLERAAGTLRERAHAPGVVPERAGERVAERIDRTADYLREHSSGEIGGDVARYVREHPVQALTGAVVAGFVLGRILR